MATSSQREQEQAGRESMWPESQPGAPEGAAKGQAAQFPASEGHGQLSSQRVNEILRDIADLYACKPHDAIFNRLYAPDMPAKESGSSGSSGGGGSGRGGGGGMQAAQTKGATGASSVSATGPVFEDPLGRMEGRDAIRLAFKGLAEVFAFVPATTAKASSSASKDTTGQQTQARGQGESQQTAADTNPDALCATLAAEYGFESFTMEQAPHTEPVTAPQSMGPRAGLVMRLHLKCNYKIKPVGPTVPFSVRTVLHLDDSGRVLLHADNWMGIPLLTPENAGWVGSLEQLRRKATGYMQQAFVKATGGDKAY